MREERSGGPAAILIVLLLLGLEAALFAAWYARTREERSAPVPAEAAIVDLGAPFQRALPGPGGTAEVFSVRVALELDLKGRRDPDRLRAEVERRISVLRSVIHLEVIGRKRPDELRRGAVLDTLALEIRERLNRELGDQLGERGLVGRVRFPDVGPESYGGR